MSWKKTRLFSALLAGLFGLASPALAAHPDERGETENLRKRIEVLEAEKEKPEAPLLVEALAKKLRFSGLFELESAYANTEGSDETSDLALATAQLEVEATVNDNIAGHMILLHEEGADESVVIDEAVITLGCSANFCPGKFSLAGGKMYLPFGKFNSHFITDPLTLDLGETNDTAVTLGWAVADRITVRAVVFAGGTDTMGDNAAIDSFAASVQATPIDGLTLGASYLSDLAESGIGLVREDPILGNVYRSSVPGAAAFLTATYGPFTLVGEYVTALKSFDDAVVAAGVDLSGSKPHAWNVELALAPDGRWEFAAKIEGAKDFRNDLLRYGGVISYGLFQNTVVALEYLLADEGKGSEDRTHVATAQLAFEF